MKATVKMDLSKVKKMLNRVEDGLKDFREPLDDIGEDLIEFYGKKNVNSQGADLGQRWKAHSIHTLMSRAKGFGHYSKAAESTTQVLVWTGKMRKGFEKKVERTRLTIDNSVDYFKYNLNRPMLGINDKVEKIILDGVVKYIKKLIS